MLHKQRYEQLDAEGTATQRAKGQRDDPEESAMYCGRVRPCGTTPHKMLPYLAGLTLPHRADGGVDANLNGVTLTRAMANIVKEIAIVWIRCNGDVPCEGPHGGITMPPRSCVRFVFSHKCSTVVKRVLLCIGECCKYCLDCVEHLIISPNNSLVL